MDPIPAAVRDAPQRLHVQVEGFSGMLPDVANGHARGPVHVAQAGQPMSAEHRIDGGAMEADERTEAVRPHPQAPAPHQNLVHLGVGEPCGRSPRTRGAIHQPWHAFQAPALQPFVGGLVGHTERRRRVGDGPMEEFNALYQQQTPKGGEFSASMGHGSPPGMERQVPAPHDGKLSSVNNVFGKYT